MNLIMFCYNFLRTTNILGFEKMMEAINNWIPDYSKVIGALKNSFIKIICWQNKPTLFLKSLQLIFLKAG